MFVFSKRSIYALSNKIRQKISGKSHRENLIIDFSRTAFKPFRRRSGIKTSPFNIKSESSYNAYLSDTSLELGLKKSNFIAWVDIPEPEYQDHIIEAKIRLDSCGGYAATGIIFRIMDEDSYYLALVSSKGYFRLDAVKNNAPKTLIAWTEISDFNGVDIKLKIITYGTYLIFIVNNKWLGETNDDSNAFGCLGFALASYTEESNEQNPENDKASSDNSRSDNSRSDNSRSEYSCKAYLDYISVNTRYKKLEEEFKKWNDDSNINAEERLRLAETFAVMGEYSKSLNQITRAWKRRDEAISSVTTSYTEVRTRKELLLAAYAAFQLEQYSESEKYIDMILDQAPDSAEGKLAYTEKLRILNELNKFAELKEFAYKFALNIEKNIGYYTLIANCHWQLKEYIESAKAWEEAFIMSKTEGLKETESLTGNGVFAVNAANAYEFAGNKKESLLHYITAAKIFLNQDNVAELAVLMPNLSVLGSKNWEARALAGKWAFSIEDYKKCEKEFDIAEKLRIACKPKQKADPAVYYLQGLVNFINGKKKAAVRLLEKAVKLAPDYELFRTKLEEIKGA